ncbi:MAG TPA: type VI secretion system tip protein TssI/VgrG [Pyrinomonadaceae bacterium]|jgi:type VI secretion system secreted protein VgrG|nr:type VI secretion system tip protein TssI/VgrG [Pyrinomonadaceae bacterium]
MAPAEEKFTQDDRVLKLTTPLGKDFLLIDSIDGSEAISSLFSYQVKVRHQEDSETSPPTVVKPEDILGQKVSVEVVQRDGTTRRHFHGIVSRFSQGNRDERWFTSYAMEVVPQLWLLTKSHRSRIFQHLNVKEILEKVLEGLDLKLQLQRTYQPKNYCVQYRESDFDFASRIMEEEGIYYYFTHTADSHKMIIADKPDSHVDCPSKSSIDFVAENTGESLTPVVHNWASDYQLQTAKIEFRDYHFQLPDKKLEAPRPSSNTNGNKGTEFYDWPGGYAKRFDGIDKGGGDQDAKLQKVFEDSAQVAQSAVDALDVRHKTYRGVSDCVSFTAGHKFTIDKLPIKDDNREYVVTSLMFHGEQSPDYTSARNELDRPLQNQFECIHSKFPPFRPQHVTPKPTVYGPETAEVVGPAGEEIFTDKYGRVKVQFHWDREGRKDGDSSCWIRVGTLWAGKQWGVIHIPRIGQEVIVDFIGGDPDQPIIVGSVWNPQTMPPYELPANKTQSGVKSRSSKSGTPDNFNEFRFEDLKGKEEVYLHAEKDFNIVVEHDETRLVMHDRMKTVNNDETSVIKHDRTETVQNDETIEIWKNRTEAVGENETIDVGKNRTHNVAGDQTKSVGKNDTLTVTQSKKAEVGDKYELIVTNEINESSKKIVITAGVELILQGPGGQIKIHAGGVDITGVLVKIN